MKHKILDLSTELITKGKLTTTKRLKVDVSHLIPMVSMNAFHSTNLFLFFTLPCSYQ